MRKLLLILREQQAPRRVWLPLLALALVFGPMQLTMPLIERYIIDHVLLSRSLRLLLPSLFAYGGLWLLLEVIYAVINYLNNYVSAHISMNLGQKIFDHCQHLSFTYVNREHSSSLVALFSNDVPNITNFFNATIVTSITSFATLTVGVFIMARINWQFGLAVLLILPLAGLAIAAVTRPLRFLARRVQDQSVELTRGLQEMLTGLREVAAYGQERSQRHRFAQAMNRSFELRMRLAVIDSTITGGRGILSLVISIVILGFGGYLVVQGKTTLGTVIAMRSLYQVMFGPALNIFSAISSMQKAWASIDRVSEFLAETPQIMDRPGGVAIARSSGTIRFDDVSFAYQPDREVLHQISFVAEPGETVALVGPSGAGKSTIINLICRFYDPIAGSITVDGVNLRDVSLSSWRENVAMVFQDTHLFATSIRDNIAFGRPDATESEIVAAARAANAWEFVERLPDKLETEVGERGVRLSEGQKQRIAIARAFLRDAPILILDEPTSALDARSERLLQAALSNIMRGRTTFVIAHRLATILRADRILVVDHGRIVQQGRHEDLVREYGLYRDMCEIQFGTRVSTA